MTVAIRRSLGFAAGIKTSNLAVKEDLLNTHQRTGKQRPCMRC